MSVDTSIVADYAAAAVEALGGQGTGGSLTMTLRRGNGGLDAMGLLSFCLVSKLMFYSSIQV